MQRGTTELRPSDTAVLPKGQWFRRQTGAEARKQQKLCDRGLIRVAVDDEAAANEAATTKAVR